MLQGLDTARFGVSVSDGTRSTFSMSPVFEIPQHAPRVWIEAAEGGFRFVGGRQVTIVARVEDVDGFPSEASVVWESDLDGVLDPPSEHRDGGYTEIWLETENLSEGDHTLTVTATDPTGLSGSHSVPMHVLHESYVPRLFEAEDDFASVRLGETVYLDVATNDSYVRGFDYMELLEDSYPVLGEAEVVDSPDGGYPVIRYTAHTEGEDWFDYAACVAQHCEVARVEVTVEPAQPAGS